MSQPVHPRLRVRAGPSLSSLKPVAVNASPTSVSSASFDGSVAVRLRGYRGPKDDEGQPEPNEGEELEEEGETWSISFEGRFGREGEEVPIDDIMFGNVWRKPIRDYLPYGTAAGLRFVKYVDPSLSCDLYADKPWALSPLFATLQRLSVKEQPASSLSDSFAPKKGTFPEDVSPILPPSTPSPPKDPASRRSFFTKAANRTSSKPLTRDLLVRGDFSHGFIDFATLSLALPGGLKFSLAKYWNGEPVVFSCQRRQKEGSTEEPETFWVVTFELVGDEGETKAAVDANAAKEKEGEAEEQNDDVD
ncbi:hypothetical protein JCM8097_006777 [Rhodosporidiobolus ruineniae]